MVALEILPLTAQQLQTEIHVIRQSGLFMPGWYIGQHRELAGRGGDGVEHFCNAGWREGANPNPYFDTAWYLASYPEIAGAGINPLLHYIAFGEAEGRNPSARFDTGWYRATHGLGPKDGCLRHFLERRETGQVSPVPVFDPAFYLNSNPDVARSRIDPFEHFCVFGVKEGRNPAAVFDLKFYQRRYGAQLEGQNPLLHYLANRDSQPGLATRAEEEKQVAAMVRRATRPAPHFEEFVPAPAGTARRAKLLAYYLPQFHPVAENDAWWGKGFTDWTNLLRASPRFAGHVQPRVPRDLGFYSLDDPETLRRQVAMAKAAGLEGFVFYTYWFNRHRLLEKPLEQFMADKTLDFSFCAMWANEHWTRRWDGMEHEVLIAQEYLESDDAALVAHFAAMFADARYIRVENRPLLMIYRAALIPGARARIAKWRAMFRQAHGEEPLIIMAQSLGEDYDPRPYGLDGAIEFPPHKLSQDTKHIEERLEELDPDFSATVHDYADFAETSLRLAPPDYPLIKTIVPGWDNDPRREGKGLVLHGATPALYQGWLEKLVEYAGKNPFHGERIICVNAWNEWAEGAYLEPDLYSGAAYLNATSRAICMHETTAFGGGILLVGHDAEPHGAQLLLLHIARRLTRNWGLKVHVLLLRAGPLLGAYHAAGDVQVAADKSVVGNLLDQYRAMGVRRVIVNTTAAAGVAPWAREHGLDVTMLVHELPQLLREYNLEIHARRAAEVARQVVFSSGYLRDKFAAAVDMDDLPAVVLAQGNYQNLRFDAAARAKVRAGLGLSDKQFLVLGAGYAHLRKGFDLFLQMARKFSTQRKDVHFVWAGNIEAAMGIYLGPEIAAATAAGCFTHVPFTEDVGGYFSAADVLALTSREDPLPTVVMEALACGVPCVAFDESGGIPELLRAENAGIVVPMADVDGFAAALASLLDHKKLEKQRPHLAAMAEQKFDFGIYVDRLLQLVAPELVQVSVAVLNYNYARYLPERLGSVFAQNYPVAEVLFLDDASSDDSIEVAAQLAADAGREMRVIANAKNAGVFAQWRRAAETAKGEYIWLCEADDDAAPALLARLVEACATADHPLLAFADSRAVDADGVQVMPSYQSYYFDAGAKDLLSSGSWPAQDFAAANLGLRNLIPNVSAVLWRREALLQALDAVPDLASWQLAGDWRLYLALAAQEGSVAYVAAPLNTHRRHGGGVTQRLSPQAHVAEIARMQALAAKQLKLGKPARAAQAADLARVETELLAGEAKKKGKPVARSKKV
jgi:glycosyltransferase involved in cell wall biosynthesis